MTKELLRLFRKGIFKSKRVIMHICPVCGYDKLWRPAEDDLICPSCGTQFGYTDAIRTHSQLRQRWIDNGKQWYSPVFPKPLDFNADFQLQKLLLSN
jgi:predicted RNA-binding Zn-ribbon protein involved in translation (DUF1610 family)